MAEESAKLAAPYVPFSTFQTALNFLKSHGVPTRVDRSALPELSGVAQGQVLGAFQFLGLIDEKGTPKDLASLAVDDAKVKPVLAEVLKRSYAEVFATGLDNASPSEFHAAMQNYKVTGATLTRAKSFFLKAAQFAEVSLSRHLTRKTRGGARRRTNGATRKRRTSGTKQSASDTTVGKKPRTPDTAMKEIRLPVVGGTLTLSGTFNAFDLVGEERELIYDIVDKMNAYGNKTKEASA